MGDVLPMQPQLATLPPLNALEFNTIIAGLQKLPYENSADLIHKLRAHVKAQLGEG